MRICKHIAVITVSLFLLLGIPFLQTDTARRWLGEKTDATSGASTVIDQPSGNYFVMINRDKHRDLEKLDTWIDFFEGKEISWIFEDITCTVARGDASGQLMAQSFQSRLPENQMKIKEEDPTLMLSKAEYGKFDILIVSAEMTELYRAQTLREKQAVQWIEIRGEKHETV